jgi:hypothetical protein
VTQQWRIRVRFLFRAERSPNLHEIEDEMLILKHRSRRVEMVHKALSAHIKAMKRFQPYLYTETVSIHTARELARLGM